VRYIMGSLFPVFSALLLLAVSAILFLVVVPRYFLGTRVGGGLAGFKDRRAVVQLGAIACFVSTIPVALSIAFAFSAEISPISLGERLADLAGKTGPASAALEGPAAAVATSIAGFLQSALFRAKEVFVVVALLLDLLLVAAILSAVFLSRDMSSGPETGKVREHAIELDNEAREALERQEA
jgi:hypothetical protein